MNVIECKKLTKSFGSFNALNDLSVSVQENKITGLIGRNGAGKTTLLKIIAGHWHKSAGEVKVFNEQPFNNIFVSANTILIDENMNFSDTLTLTEIFSFAEKFYKTWDADFANRLFNYFSFQATSIYNHLSKGKKSTFRAIIGLASRCALTLFDEPTTGMDASVRKDFYRALLKDYIDHPRTFIISSHHLNEIEDILEDILLIGEGRKYLHLPIDDVKEYAIGVTGDTKKIEQLIDVEEVIYKQSLNQENCYVVIRNEGQTEKLAGSGFDITPVRPNDLCVYLTNQSKGGIDDVFNESTVK